MKFTAASSAATVALLAATIAADPAHIPRRSMQHHHNLIAARQPRSNDLHNATDFDLAMAHSLAKRGGSGSATFYNTQTGNAGSCGQMLNNGEMVVALASPGWGVRKDACGKTIVITVNGQTHNARVMDTCPTGGGNCGGPCDIDMSPSLFSQFAPQSVGKMFGVSWYYADTGKSCDGGSSGHNNDNPVGNIVKGVQGVLGGGKKNHDDSNDNDQKQKDDDAAAQKAQDAADAAAAKAKADKEAEQEAEAAKSSSASAARASSSASAARASSASAARVSSKAAAAKASKKAEAHASKASAASVKSAYAAKKSAWDKEPKNAMYVNDVMNGLYAMAGAAATPTPAP